MGVSSKHIMAIGKLQSKWNTLSIYKGVSLATPKNADHGIGSRAGHVRRGDVKLAERVRGPPVCVQRKSGSSNTKTHPLRSKMAQGHWCPRILIFKGGFMLVAPKGPKL